MKRNIRVAGRRTSVSLAPEFWRALSAIAQQTDLTESQLAGRVAQAAGGRRIAAAIRVFVVAWLAGHRAEGGSPPQA